MRESNARAIDSLLMRGDLTEEERDELLRLSSYMKYEKVEVNPAYL